MVQSRQQHNGGGDTMQDYAAKIAFFLLDRTGSIWGTFKGTLSKKEQLGLFGRYIGKGQIVIDGLHETVCNRVKVCFGMDWDDRNWTQFAEFSNQELPGVKKKRRF